MPTESVLLTLLPNGLNAEGDAARASVLLTPRVAGDAMRLKDARWVLRWPETVRRLADGLGLEVEGAGRAAARVRWALRDGLWEALLPPETRVRPHEPEEHAHRPIATYAASTVHRRVTEAVAVAALASPAAPLSARELTRVLDEEMATWTALLDVPSPSQLGEGAISRALRERMARSFGKPLADALAARIEGGFAAARAEAAARRAAYAGAPMPADRAYVPATAAPVGGVGGELHRLLAFHHRAQRPPTPLPAPDELAAELDLHRIVSGLGGYPALLRWTGLVLDVEAPLELVRAGGPLGRARVAPVGGLDGLALVTPWTAFALEAVGDRERFEARSRPEGAAEPVLHGLLDLRARERFSLAQVDVDAAGLKALNAAMAAAAHALLPRQVGTPDAEAPPALRSTGLALLCDDRAGALHERLAHAHNAGLAPEPTFYAEDLVRGYRLDVREARTGRWRSLHARIGTYAAPDLDEEVADEGFAQLALGEPARPPGAPADPDGELYLHESLARWEGWSLSAPRAGLALSRSPHAPDDADPDTQPVPDANPPLPGGVPLSVTFRAAPGTLPRLRFGGGYSVRARAVDLAGNGPTLEEADALLEALADPPVLPRTSEPLRFRRFDPVAAPVLVPRAPPGEGESVEHVVVRSDHDRSPAAYAGDTGYPDHADRHLAPPKTAQQLAELHGTFDSAIGTADAAAVAETYALASREAGRLEAVHPEAPLVLTYLPDPWSAGPALIGLPGVPDGTIATLPPMGR